MSKLTKMSHLKAALTDAKNWVTEMIVAVTEAIDEVNEKAEKGAARVEGETLVIGNDEKEEV